MTERTESDRLRFNHWGFAVAGLAFLAMLVVFFGWLDRRRAQAEVRHLYERLCGRIPDGLQREFDRMNSSPDPAPAAFASLHSMAKSWTGSIGHESYDVQLFREEGPVWRDVTWNEEWHVVHEKPSDDLLRNEDCATDLQDERIGGARRYRGAARNIVVVATRQRD